MIKMWELAQVYATFRVVFEFDTVSKQVFTWLKNKYPDRYKECLAHYLLIEDTNGFISCPEGHQLMTYNLNGILNVMYVNQDEPKCKGLKAYKELYAAFERYDYNQLQAALKQMLDSAIVAEEDQGTCTITISNVTKTTIAYAFCRNMAVTTANGCGLTELDKMKFDLGPMKGVMISKFSTWANMARVKCVVDHWDLEEAPRTKNINAYREREPLLRDLPGHVGRMKLALYSPETDPHKKETENG